RPGDKRLVGYVTGDVEVSGLRARLASALPGYLVPAAVVRLARLPLTVNGKLDTAALPAPEYGQADRYQAPSSPVEEVLAGIYAQVLGLDRVGVDASFFELGGDSLLAMRAIAAVNAALDTDLAVRTLFDAPSVQSLSRRLGAPDSSTEVVPVEILKDGTGAPLFCLPPASGLSWPYRGLGSYVDCPIIGIQQVSRSGESGPGSIRELATNYMDTIQALHGGSQFNLLGWSFGGAVAHQLAVELRGQGYAVGRLILLDAVLFGDAMRAENAANATDSVSESDALEAVLKALGIDTRDQSEPLTYRQAEALVSQHEATELPFPSRQLLATLVENANRNTSLLSQHVPDIFDGDMVIFSATRGGSGSPLLQSWRPYVDGDITEYRIDCAHDEMLTPESLRLFGHQLRAALEA
ncbi:non-ribosomal peptide synthetase, partial [Mycobacterium simiae]